MSGPTKTAARRRERLLLVGTGRMAGKHAERFADLEGCTLAGAVDVVEARVHEFADRHEIPGRFTSVTEALATGGFDAVSVITPDPHHEAPVAAALAAGLPVLCEKPLSDSMASAERMLAAADAAGVPNLVNLTYRSSRALATARRLVREGRIGEVRHVSASYLQSWLTSDYWGDWRTEPTWLWRLSSQHGSLGVLGDVGIHILDYALAGTGLDVSGLQCRLQTFHKAPGDRIGEYPLDANDSCVINVGFGDGALGVVHLSRFASGHLNTLELVMHGTEGAISVRTDTEGDTLRVSFGEDRHAGRWRKHPMDPADDVFTRFRDALRAHRAGRAPAPELPDFRHAARLQLLLERCAESHDAGRWIDL